MSSCLSWNSVSRSGWPWTLPASARTTPGFTLFPNPATLLELFNLSQIKLLNKELQALREAGAQATESLQKAETEHTELERKLQDRARELQALEAMRDARCVGSARRKASWVAVRTRSWWLPPRPLPAPLWSLCNCSLLIRFLFRIKDLERKLHSLHLAKKKAEETFRRKCVFPPGWCH